MAVCNVLVTGCLILVVLLRSASVVLMDSSACVSRDIKLAGSDSPSEGRVEVCVNGTRARVCAENWSSLEVNLVCTLYQFDKGNLVNSSDTLRFFNGTESLEKKYNVTCSGNESSLYNCSFDIVNSSCAVVAVHCGGAVPGSSLSVAVITNGSESIVLSWQSPNASKYGVIIKYTAECNGVLYSTNLTTLEIGSLHPFTQYNCCVVAFNLGGNGSKNCDSATTNQAAPSGVPLSVDTQYEHLTAFQLSWSPPQESLRNGIIQSYEVIIYDHQSGENRTFSTVASSVIISALPGYQYTCSVAAVTIATGPTKEIPHFQDEQTPLPPTILAATRLSATSINVIIQPLKFPNEAKGIITSYQYYSTDRNTTCSGLRCPCGSRQTNVTLDIESNKRYFVSASAQNRGGISPCNGSLHVDLFDNSIFILELRGTIHCLEWTRVTLRKAKNVYVCYLEDHHVHLWVNKELCRYGNCEQHSNSKSTSHVHHSANKIIIVENIEMALRKQCNCSFSSNYVADEGFYCQHNDSASVLFEGRIITDEHVTSADRLNHLQQWVFTGPVISIGGVLLTVSDNCDVHSEVVGSTNIKCSQPSKSHSVAVGVTVSLFLVMVAVIVGVIVFLVICKRYRERKMEDADLAKSSIVDGSDTAKSKVISYKKAPIIPESSTGLNSYTAPPKVYTLKPQETAVQSEAADVAPTHLSSISKGTSSKSETSIPTSKAKISRSSSAVSSSTTVQRASLPTARPAGGKSTAVASTKVQHSDSLRKPKAKQPPSEQHQRSLPGKHETVVQPNATALKKKALIPPSKKPPPVSKKPEVISKSGAIPVGDGFAYEEVTGFKMKFSASEEGLYEPVALPLDARPHQQDSASHGYQALLTRQEPDVNATSAYEDLKHP